jgi:large repetitive protein
MNGSLRSQLLACAAAAMLCLPAAVQPIAAQPAFRVADIDADGPASSFLWPHGTDFAEVSGDVYFAVSDGVHGTELWAADAATAASPALVADLCPGACSSHPRGLTAVGAQLFFAADDGAHGDELWVSDGAGPRLVADLVPGLPGSNPVPFAALGGKLVFSAHDPARGRELWASDGTAAGTERLHEIFPGPAGAASTFLGAAGPRLLFIADDPDHGSELWATDGTAAGTGRVADICPGTGSSLSDGSLFPGFAIAAPAGGQLFFAADDCTHGTELWASDGTAAGTHLVEDIGTGSDGSSPNGFTALGASVYFNATDGASGHELWVSDGTAPGTHLVEDIRPGSDGAQPREIAALGGKVYFHADDGVHGRELWSSDGTPAGTDLLADVRPDGDGFAFLALHALSAVGPRLVFFADDGVHGNEPWASDGTPAGTAPLGDFRPGFDSFFPWALTFVPDRHAVLGGRLFFRAADGLSDLEVWSTDGTAAGTWQVGDVNTRSSAFDVLFFGRLGAVRPLAGIGGAILFPARDGDGAGSAPWVSDGSAAGTVRLAEPAVLESSFGPQEFTVLGDAALFAAANGVAGHALWRTDGTPAGTFRLAEDQDFDNDPPAWLTRLGERVLFAGGGRLWASDGTLDGTLPVATGVSGDPGSPAALTPLGEAPAGVLLLRAHSAGQGEELWATDGTAPGTFRVLDIWPGPASSSPTSLTAAGGQVFFSAEDPDAGRELWVSDGSDEGTRRVADIRPGPASALPRLWDQPDVSDERVAALGSVLFFLADDGVHGEELWKSDGGEKGTGLVRDLFPGPRSADIRWLTAAGSRVYFVADDGVHGRELWTSDGTSDGTRLVEDILPGAGSALPHDLAWIDGLLLFSAHDGEDGVEPWKSNGTAAGTSRIQDIAPGPLPSTPLAFTAAGPNVYFAANDATAGFELWALPRTALSRFADVPPGHWAWPFVEALAAAGISAGCGGGDFCPAAQVSRAQMAVFLVTAVHGSGFTPPPATGTRFTDVPADAFAAAFIEQLASDGITSGCSLTPPRYCPDAKVSRAQMAVFLLVAKHGPGYQPPAGTGAVFTDVGPAHWARDWIEQLAAEGITGGCGGGKFCPDGIVTRAEMAVFLTATFELLP